MANDITKITDLVDPEVMADMISAKLPQKIKITPYADIDTTLEGVPGDTVTVPKFEYIGDAEDVAEGVEAGTVKLTSTTTKAKVKKAMKVVSITDEAVLSGYGDPVGQANSQLLMSIAAKVDNDSMDALQTAKMTYTDTGIISYDGIVNAVDLFEEEDQVAKVMFVNPKQVTQLRLDNDFKDIRQYPLETVMTGVIGEIAGCQIVPSKKVPLKSGVYTCPIVKIQTDEEVDDVTAAITVYLKRRANVETDRNIKSKVTDIAVDQHYTVALSNDSKVVLAKFKATAGA
jgi:N4-gp56 family major capsid protein